MDQRTKEEIKRDDDERIAFAERVNKQLVEDWERNPRGFPPRLLVPYRDGED